MLEVEIKLTALPPDVPKLRQALLEISGRTDPRASMLVTTYFDTPDLALLHQGKILRIRRDGPNFIQTVKADNVSGTIFLARNESEDPVPSGEVFFGAPNTGEHLASIAGKELQPLFTVEVERTTIMLELNAATTVEAVIDQGGVRAVSNGAFETVCEIELELKQGEPSALYDVALRLLDAAPLRLSTITKAERGYRLAKGGAARPLARHAGSAILTPDMTVEDALLAISRSSLLHILDNEAAVLARIPEGLHQIRVALRRLRSVLSAFRSMLPEDHYRWVSGETKELADALGDARNWDVLALSLLPPAIAALPAGEELASLSKACARRRQEEFERAREAVLSPRHTQALLRLAHWFESRAWRDQPDSGGPVQLASPVTAIAPRLMEERMCAFLKKSRHLDRLDEQGRHKLRIASKKLRYMIEALGSLYKARQTNPFLLRLKPIQEILGHANDVAVARRLLKTVTGPGSRRSLGYASGLVLGWQSRGLADQEKELGNHLARLRNTKPFW